MKLIGEWFFQLFAFILHIQISTACIPNVSNCKGEKSETVLTETGEKCIFPFKDGSIEHSTCAEYKNEYTWCALSLKADCTFQKWARCAEKETPTCSKNEKDHRIFGSNLAIEKSLWQVALVYVKPNPQQSAIFCGGSLITVTTVVTAGHCMLTTNNIPKDKDAFLAAVGLLDLSDQSNVVQQKVHNIVLYPAYYTDFPGVRAGVNDIALVIIEKIPDTFKNYQLISLPPANTDTDGLCATAMGWGLIQQNPTQKYPNKLQVLQAKVVSNKECNQFWNGRITDKNICFAAEAAQGTCHGDSGGPLVFRGQLNGQGGVYLIGVASYGPPDCSAGLPSVFTRVDKYLDFIEPN